MDPLFKVTTSAILPEKVKSALSRRISYLRKGVERVESASKLRYPPYYIEPVLMTAVAPSELGQMGVYYARTLPVEVDGHVEILVQLAAPLILYAASGTIEAVLAHEFLHYCEMVRRFSKMDLLSDEVSASLRESAHADAGRLFQAKDIFADRGLLTMIKRRFPNGLRDDRLDATVLKKWIQTGLPTEPIGPEANVTKVNIQAVLASSFDPLLKAKIQRFESRSVK
jgi:hypothetical protein